MALLDPSDLAPRGIGPRALHGVVPAERLEASAFAALRTPFPADGTLLIVARRGRVMAAARPVNAPCGARDLRVWIAPRAASVDLIRRLEALGGETGASAVRLQEKIAVEGEGARRLEEIGFEARYRSGVHEIDVPSAARLLDRLRFPVERLGDVRTCSLDADATGAVPDLLEDAALLDRFEFESRAGRPGAGGFDLGESPCLVEGEAVRGLVLIGRGARGATRDIVARWVAPGWRGLSLVNLALMQECLSRAHAAGVRRARFRANPDRHRETMSLARRLGARAVGEIASYARPLD